MSTNEFIDKAELEEKEKKEKKKKSVRKERAKKPSNRIFVQLMNGEFVARDNFIRNLPFLFYIGMLLVVMIGWGYYGETVTKQELMLEKELSELNSEFYTLASEYNTKRGRRQIADQLKEIGVVENESTQKKIRIPKYVFKKND